MTKVSLVILNWNRKKDTLDCLKSIERLKIMGYKLEIIVVDNGSTDDSVKEIRKELKRNSFKRKNMSWEVIRNRQNLGFAAGNNIGIKRALALDSDFIVILNNDTLVDEDLILEFLRFITKYPKAGILSPKIYFAPGFEYHKELYKHFDLGKVIWYAGGDIDWANVYGTNHGVDQVDKGQYDKVRQIDFATGSCMFITRKAIEETGFFDEKYYMYLEDEDLSIRMKKRGWDVLYIPMAKIWHKVAQSSEIGSNLNDYFITRNRLLFGMRYATVRTRLALYRESLRFILNGRKSQRKGVIDFYFGRFGRGSWK